MKTPPELSPEVDVLAADSLPDAGLPIAANALGIDLRHVADVYEQATATGLTARVSTTE